MTTLTMKDMSGAAAGECIVDDAWLEREKGEQAVHETIVAHLAAQRQGSASVKNRSAVRGGGAKPYRQKGTGHARAGSIRSPLWRGGGTIFGPTPRSYRKKVNKKIKRLALRRALAECVDAGALIVLNKIELTEPKTKATLELLNAVGAGENAIIVDAVISENLKRSARNLPKVAVVPAAELTVYELLHHRAVVITQAGFEALGQRLS